MNEELRPRPMRRSLPALSAAVFAMAAFGTASADDDDRRQRQFKPLHRDPRYQALLRRLKLPQQA